MPKNSGHKNLIPAKKGEPSRNPNGRPKGSPNRATVLRKWLDIATKVKNPETGEMLEGTVEDRVAMALIAKAIKGDVQAIKEINDSLYGKAHQAIQVGGDPENPLHIIWKEEILGDEAE